VSARFPDQITAAKKDDTRLRRLHTAIERLAAGERR
jgi:hypothetical protein